MESACLKIGTICFAAFASTFGTMMVFAFQPFMIESFFPNVTREEIGWKTGYLSGIYFLGSFFGGIFWGWLADEWGRRPSILSAITGAIIFQILFGLSKNFLWALLTRFIWGFTNSIIAVFKTYASETLSDKQQAQGFAAYGIAIGLATIIGPVVGGFLAQPADKYEIFQNSYFCYYPFVLPCFICVLLSFIGLTGSCLFLNETMIKHDFKVLNKNVGDFSDDTTTTTDDDLSDDEKKYGSKSTTDPKKMKHRLNSLKDMFLYFHSQLTSTLAIAIEFQKEESAKCFRCCRYPPNQKHQDEIKFLDQIKLKSRFFMEALFDRTVIATLIIFVSIGGVELIVFEIFELLFISKKEKGGYSMNGNELGFSFMVAGINELLFQLLLYSKLVKILSLRGMLAISTLSFAFSTFIVPWGTALPVQIQSVHLVYQHDAGNDSLFTDSQLTYCGENTTDLNNLNNPFHRLTVVAWIIVLILVSTVTCARTTAYLTITILLNNSAVSQTKGTVNGVAQSVVSLFRSFVHTFLNLLFAWSQNNSVGKWPLNYHLTFLLSSIFVLCLMPIIGCLPSSIEKKKTDHSLVSGKGHVTTK